MAWGEQWGRGRCINCGFLGKRDCVSSISVCYEATAADRLAGQLTEYRMEPTQHGGMTNRALLRTYPWCFLGKAHILDELNSIGAKDHQTDKVQQIIQKDRQCGSWYPWTEFRTPKEHFEEFKMLELEQRREEFEKHMEENRKEFEFKLQKRNEQERKRTDKVMIGLAIAATILALAEVFAALAALTPDSMLFQWFG